MSPNDVCEIKICQWIFLQNREAVIGALDGAGASLDRLRALVANGNESELRAYLEQAAEFRSSLDR